MDALVRHGKRNLTVIANDTASPGVGIGKLINAKLVGKAIVSHLTPTGVGTLAEEGKRTIESDGKTFLLELPLRADFALIHAMVADYLGNLYYALTARNFNPIMAMAADTVMATAENIVPVGVISPDHAVTPGPLVDYFILNEEDI